MRRSVRAASRRGGGAQFEVQLPKAWAIRDRLKGK